MPPEDASPNAVSTTPPPRGAVPDDRFAHHLRGFGPIGLLAILAIFAGNFIVMPLSAVLVLVWARRSHTPWRELGFVRPRSWFRCLVFGSMFGVALKLLMKAIVMPLLGAPPINQAFHYLAGNTAALPGAIFLMIVVAGFGEETLFRGYLFERLGKLLGPGALAKITIVLTTSIWFGLIHYPFQGMPGAEQALIVGLLYGSIFALTGQLPFLMVAHAVFDLTALAIIYWDVETAVARSVFG